MLKMLICGALVLSLVSCGDEVSDEPGASENNASNNSSNNDENNTSNNAGQVRYRWTMLCEGWSFSEPVPCSRDSDCAEQLPVAVFGEYGCNSDHSRCTKVCQMGVECDGAREGACVEVAPLVCGYGQPGDPLEALVTNGQQCGSSDDCPPKHENTPLLGCGQLGHD